MPKILLIGNCHIVGFADCLEIMTEVKVDRYQIQNNNNILSDLSERIEAADIVGVISTFKGNIIKYFPDIDKKLCLIPHVMTRAFQPDIVYVTNNEDRVETLMGRNNSAITLFGFLNNLNVDQTLSLFNEKVYEYLGYLDVWSESERWAISQEEQTGWPVLSLYKAWARDGSFVHTCNHPRLTVFADLARIFAQKNNIEIVYNHPLDLLSDRAARQAIWPVYLPIAKRFGFEGDYFFKVPAAIQKTLMGNPISISLKKFVEDSFQRYSTFDRAGFKCEFLEKAPFNSFLKSSVLQSALRSKQNIIKDKPGNPYQYLPDYQFWKRAIARPDMSDVDPVVRAKFKIKYSDKVATAGSCFAQHIARTLKNLGFTYYVAELAPAGISNEEAEKRNYGVFSSRYGNIYTTKQLLQLFDRAFGTFVPVDSTWIREDGQYVDPFRPLIELEGFDTIDAVEKSRQEHFSYVREMFKNLDVFVFTLGLTEAWRSSLDGSVFPLAPGVAGGTAEREKYEFVNFTVDDVVADFDAFSKRLFKVNPRARILLTVSPVPLMATYEDNHVLVATTYSKSVLRVAAEHLTRNNENIDYFPSFEIITGNFNRGDYFAEDLRTVTQKGVDHVMRLLVKHYVNENTKSVSEAELQEATIVCDEEALD